MRFIYSIYLCGLSLLFLIQEQPKQIIIEIKNEAAIKVYIDALSRMEQAKSLVENSPVWKDYIIAQNQVQSSFLYALGEEGIKPSSLEGMDCQPIFKEKKFLHFECKEKK